VVITTDGISPLSLVNTTPSIDTAGRVLVITARGDDGVARLYARRFDQVDAVPIAGTEGLVIGSLAISPDGSWVAFITNQQLRKVALGSGTPFQLQPMPDANRGIAWAGAESLIVGKSAGLYRVPAAGGTAEQITHVDAQAGELDHRWPYVTPDGVMLAYTVWSGSTATARVRLRSLRTGQERTLMPGTSPRLTTTGHLIFYRDAALWVAPIDLETLEVRREAVPVLEGVNGTLTGEGSFAVSGDGMLVYSRRVERAGPLAVWARSGTAVDTLGESFPGVHHGPPRFSPSGQVVAICRHPTGGGDQIVIHDLRRRGAILVARTGDSRFPVWTPDGTRLTFTSTRKGTGDIFEVSLSSGGAEPQPLLVREGDQIPWSWTPDGEVLAFTEGTPANNDIWLLPRNGDPRPLLANQNVNENFPAFSLDGKFLAYVSNESGRPEVYVQTYPRADRRIQVSTGGGVSPIWARDGIYFHALDGTGIFHMPFETGSRLSDGVTLQRIANLGVGVRGFESGFDVSRDGQTFVTLADDESPRGSLELIVNWTEELKRLVPGK
jgi:Tol biopolymer transport system component